MPTARFIGGPKDGTTVEVPRLDQMLRVHGPPHTLECYDQPANTARHINTYVYRLGEGNAYHYDGFE